MLNSRNHAAFGRRIAVVPAALQCCAQKAWCRRTIAHRSAVVHTVAAARGCSLPSSHIRFASGVRILVGHDPRGNDEFPLLSTMSVGAGTSKPAESGLISVFHRASDRQDVGEDGPADPYEQLSAGVSARVDDGFVDPLLDPIPPG